MHLRLDSHVQTTDGLSGTLADVVLDPVKRAVTHVVVRAGDPDPAARLVPLQLVGGGEAGGALSLTCTAAQFAQLESIQGYAYLPVDERPAPDSEWDVGVEDVVMMPSYQGADLGVYTAEIDPNVGVTYDRVPKGEVEIRRASVVASSDEHELGAVGAVVVEDGRITHVVVEHGHLWWHRVVSVPIESVATLETNAIGLSLTKGEFGKLPSTKR
jgi:sporulation protein YlmC with PRC-barrel domain